LDQGIVDCNVAYANTDMTFYLLSVDYINSDDYYYNIDTGAEIDALRGENVIANAVNVYFTPNLDGGSGPICGRASFTTSAVQGAVIANGCTGLSSNPTTFPHELGHYFDLFHTHETSFGAELVDGTNCGVAGDLLCDTPADPRLRSSAPGQNVTSDCIYYGAETDANGDSYTPDTHQLMSYAPKTCRDDMSPMSEAKAQATLLNLRANHLNRGCMPVADAGPDLLVECTSPTTTAVMLDGTSSSDSDGDPLDYLWSAPGVVFNDNTSPTPTGQFPHGTTTVTLQVTDGTFNVTDEIDVTIVDTTPPAIACPTPVTVECTEAGGGVLANDPQLAAFWAGVSASDICDLNPVIADNAPAIFPMGTTTVTFTATDDHNNQNDCDVDVTVEDVTPPDIVCPDDMTVICTGAGGTPADNEQLDPFWAGVSATDVCDPNPVITDDAPGFFLIGTTPVTFTATDLDGNDNSCIANVTVEDRGLNLWLDSLLANPGENLLVPVYIQDVTGWGVLGFDMEICWCDLPAGLLEFEYCQVGEVMTNSGWGDPVCGPCGDNCISIAGAGAGPLVGEGVLFYLKFAVSTNAKPCMCCDIWFTHINLYDPEEPLNVCWQDGQICIDWCDVEGVVNYWKCCFDECDEPYFIKQLDGAYMHLTDCLGNHIESQYSDADGYYLFDCLDPLNAINTCYCVSIDYCPILPCVTSMDAALVLQNVVCLDDLDDCAFNYNGGMVYPQQVAADVNCSGVVTSLDASYILQYSVGLINIFPCPDPWKFYAIPGNCVSTCPGEIDWIGVMYGDVNGCPACPPAGPVMDVISPASVKLGRPVHYDDRVEIPIKVKQTSEVMAADLVVDFDPVDFSVNDVEAIGLASGFSMAFNPVGGKLFIGMAGTSRFSGDGRIARIVLSKNYQPIPSTRGKVSIASAYFNDVEAQVIGDRSDYRMEYALGPIAPNPFADGTTVRFTMASAGNVSLNVYNVNGRLVTATCRPAQCQLGRKRRNRGQGSPRRVLLSDDYRGDDRHREDGVPGIAN
jgi:hypothetical protein